MSIKFPYYREVIVNGEGIGKSQLRAKIKIRIFNKKRYVDVLALIDSGADYCLFSGEIAEIIGIENIRDGHKLDFFGLEGRSISFYSNDIEIQVGNYKFPCEGYFSYKYKGPPLLGENGFFSVFKVIFDFQEEEIELVRK
jgi:hypothetical protein